MATAVSDSAIDVVRNFVVNIRIQIHGEIEILLTRAAENNPGMPCPSLTSRTNSSRVGGSCRCNSC